MGHGYELTGLDAHEAQRLAVDAVGHAHQTEQVRVAIEQVRAAERPMSAWMRRVIGIASGALRARPH